MFLPTERQRAILFAIGDCLFLTAVGMVTTWAMHATHQLGWNFAFTCVVGMAVAMLVQMLMALCVAPLLGSIETMTPSMVVGMVSPMAVCTMHLFGHESDSTMALAAGAMFGMAMFVYVEIFGARAKQRLRQAYPIG